MPALRPVCSTRRSVSFKLILHLDPAAPSGPLCFYPMQNSHSDRPDTPCVAVCSTTFDDICRGCGRTVIEVAEWVFMSDEQKNIVWDRILSQGYPRRNS